MKCCHCDAELAPNAKFCRHCGKEIVTFCTECGQQLEKGAKFCTSCGTKVEEFKEEEKKNDILPTMGELALEMTEKVLEKVEGDNHSTHWEEVRNAKPVQVETPARSESPAKPQSSTHTDGSAGGAGQKIRRSSASVRNAAAHQAQSVSDDVPVEALQTCEVAAPQTAAPAPQTSAATQTPAPAQVQPSAAPQNMPAYNPAPVQTQVPPLTPVGTAVRPPVQVPLQQTAPVTGTIVNKMTDTATEIIKEGSKKLSVGKTVAIWAAVVAFVIGAATACLNFFVPAPADTVDKLIVSVEELKYDDMLSCFDSTTEKQIRAVMGITGDLFGSLTGISIDLEDLMAFAPSMESYLEIPDLGIASAETVLYADCSKSKLMTYCQTANSGGSIPTGYLSDNEIVNFLMEYNISLPGLENLIAEVAVVKITLQSGEVGYLPLINEGWGDWRIPVMDMINGEGLG